MSEAPDRHHLVCLHHHPVSVGCPWLEPIGLRNAKEFLVGHGPLSPGPGGTVGHVHQAFDQQRNDVRLLATPLTCIQFAVGSPNCKVSGEAPGYRWLRLQPDGTLQTGVSRLADFTFEPDYSASNY